ncbi:MAG: Hsp20/alpha crystallin family protein [Pseudomonadota bacterium]|jgi:HSP20 family protein
MSRRDDFFDSMFSLRREVDRIFDEFFNAFGSFGQTGLSLRPAVDIAEDDKELVISAEIPGLDEKDLEVSLAGDLLTIKGEKKAEHEERNGGAYYVERRYGSFSRSVRLPFQVDDQNVEAKYDKGVLTIRIPKPIEMQKAVRRIPIKSS